MGNPAVFIVICRAEIGRGATKSLLKNTIKPLSDKFKTCISPVHPRHWLLKLRCHVATWLLTPQPPCSYRQKVRTEKVQEKKTRTTQQSKWSFLSLSKIFALFLGMITEKRRTHRDKEKERKTQEFPNFLPFASLFSSSCCVIWKNTGVRQIVTTVLGTIKCWIENVIINIV